MKKKIAAVAVAATAVVAATMAFAGCGEKVNVAGTYTVSLSSGEYYALEEVQDFVESHPIRGQLAEMNLWTVEMYWNMITHGILNEDGTEFLTSGGVEDYYTATLVLESNGTYSLTKKIKTDTSETPGNQLAIFGDVDPCIEVTFEGDYTADKTSVTLKTPDTISGNILTGPGDTSASYFPLESNCPDFSITPEDADDLLYPGRYFYYFNGLYFTESSEYTDMTVTLDAENTTFDVN